MKNLNFFTDLIHMDFKMVIAKIKLSQKQDLKGL